MFCLVAIYSVIGEELKPHLAQLTGSKVCIVFSVAWAEVYTCALPACHKHTCLQPWTPDTFLIMCVWALFLQKHFSRDETNQLCNTDTLSTVWSAVTSSFEMIAFNDRNMTLFIFFSQKY